MHLDLRKYTGLAYSLHQDYWEGQLRHLAEPMRTDMAWSVEAGADGEAGRVLVSLSEAARTTLQRISGGNALAELVVVAAACAWLFGKYNRCDSPVFHSPLLAPLPEPLPQQVIPIVIHGAGAKTVRDLLSASKAGITQAYRFQDFPLVELLGAKAPYIGEVTDILISHHGLHVDKELEGYALHIRLVEEALQITFDGRRVGVGFVKEIGHILGKILDLFQDTGLELVGQEWLEAGLRKKMLEEWGSRTSSYPKDRGVAEAFRIQARQIPHALAVDDGQMRLSYKELDELSDRVAGWLMVQETWKGGATAGILTGRNAWMVVGLLGVLKAGCAYVPLDPDYPSARLDFILQDTQPMALLLVSELLMAMELPQDMLLFALDIQTELCELPQQEWPMVEPMDLAYIIYTSGSTGQPKGVRVLHRGILRLVSAGDYCELSTGDRLLQTGALSFDASTFEIWGCLLNGATLLLAPKEKILDTRPLKALIRDWEVNVFWITTSFFKLLVDADLELFQPLRWLGFGGDHVSMSHVERFRLSCPQVELVHFYGPTENTTFSTFFKVLPEHEGRLPIGIPLLNSTVDVLGRNGELLPPGFVGEICVGGDGLAEGYHNQPGLSAEKFVPHPQRPGHFMYRTGDLGRWLPHGQLDIVGREDQQLKIRGFRIEPAEIEAVLLGHPQVAAVVVGAWMEQSGEKTLVAWVVANGTWPEDLRIYLGERLPAYMVPDFWVPIHEIPLTLNRKIDVRSLPSPHLVPQAKAEAPGTATETQLLALWEEVLECKGFGVLDDFFEWGGHSLKAARLASLVGSRLGKSLSLAEIFSTPTVRALGSLLDQQVRGQTSIPELTHQEDVLASSAQGRLYLLHAAGAVNAYNMPAALVLEGDLQADVFAEALGLLVERHASLRTTFYMREGQVWQRQHTQLEPDFSVVDMALSLGGLEWAGAELLLQEWADENARHVFDLERGPLVRGRLLDCGEGHWVLLLNLHHLISDGWSMEVILQEWEMLYRALTKGELPALAPLSISYRDFSAWQAEILAGEEGIRQGNYWKEVLAAPRIRTEISGDLSVPAQATWEGGSEVLDFGVQTTRALEVWTGRTGLRMFPVVTALLQAWLSRLLGQSDILIGTVVAGRSHPDVQGIVGLFVNTICLRAQVGAEMSLNELAHEGQVQLNATLGAQDYPFDQLAEEIAEDRLAHQNPFFSIMLSLDEFVLEERLEAEGFAGLRTRRLGTEFQGSKVDLLFEFRMQETLQLGLQYQRDRYSAIYIQHLLKDFGAFVAHAVTQPEAPIGQLARVDSEMFGRLKAFQPAHKDYPEKAFPHLIEEMAQYRAEANAVVMGEERLTYGTLLENSGRVAQALLDQGLSEGSVVGLYGWQNIAVVCAYIGILRAGMVVLPLTPELPQGRRETMYRQAGAALVIDCEGHRETLEIPVLAYASTQIAKPVDKGLVRSLDDAAFVIFTSGSTGQPKGVLLAYRGIQEWVLGNAHHDAGPNDRFLWQPSMLFDAAFNELIAALACGGCLYLMDEHSRRDPKAIGKAIQDYGITRLTLSTAMFHAVVDQCVENLKGIQCLHFGGEAVSGSRVQKAFEITGPGVLVNGYGPTEASVAVSTFRVDEVPSSTQALPIGRVIPNKEVYLLDAEGHFVPIGIEGELVITGEGLAIGYLGASAQDQARFGEMEIGGRRKRVYRTGDLACWDTEGQLYFRGRRDQQLKIRGYRIELGEIESAVLRLPEVQAVKVLSHKDKEGEVELVGFVQTSATISEREMRSSLQQELPAYMIPSVWVQVETFPFNVNGKLDTQVLLALVDAQDTGLEDSEWAYESPVMETLAGLWGQVLGGKGYRPEDDFFAAGGHSLKAMRLAGLIYRAWGQEMRVKDLYEHPTLMAQTALIQAEQKRNFVAIPLTPISAHYSLSFNQTQLWVAQMADEENAAYNMPGAFRLRGHLNLQAFRLALDGLVRRHPAFRTAFPLIEGVPKQVLQPPSEVPFLIISLEGQDLEAAQTWMKEDAARPFVLVQAPLVRIALLRLAEQDHVCYFLLHHIISDGWSMEIFFREWTLLYKAALEGTRNELPPLRLNYMDFAVWQAEQLKSLKGKETEAFWVKFLENQATPLQLPIDFARPARRTYNGQALAIILPNELAYELPRLGERLGISDYALLLGAWQLLLSQISGQQQFLTGSPFAGRNHPDLEGIIGFFIQMLPIPALIDPELSFEDFVKALASRIVAAQTHQDYPSGRLMELLSLQNDPSRHPLYDAGLTWQSNFSGIPEGEEVPGLKIEVLDPEVTHTQHDLWLFGQRSAGGHAWELALTYNSDLFRPTTIQVLVDQLLGLLQSILLDHTTPLKALAANAQTPEKDLSVDFDF